MHRTFSLSTSLNSFGSIMEGRSYEGDTNLRYRFGFNTQEKDDEIYGAGNSITAEFWEYNTRLGRRWNLDPKPLQGISQYACFGNNPISNIDPDGQFVIKGRNREERRNLRFIIKETFKEAMSWNQSQWRGVLATTGYRSKWQYLKSFIPGLGPTLQFSDPNSITDGPALGNGNGNPVSPSGNPSAYAQTVSTSTASITSSTGVVTGGRPLQSTITLDEGINRLMSDLRTSNKGHQPVGVFSKTGGFRQTNMAQYLRTETTLTIRFVTTVLGHEIAHHGAFMNRLPDAAPPLERGQMHEMAVNFAVTGHTNYGFGVYSAMQRRLWTPNIPNGTLDRQRSTFFRGLYGPGF
jgi:RHS repeat-associated protein